MSVETTNIAICSTVAQSFNDNYISQLQTRLQTITGLSDTDKDNIINQVSNEQPLIGTTDLDLTSLISKELDKFNSDLSQVKLEVQEAVEKQEEQEAIKDHTLQEAQEGFTIKEVKIQSKVQTTNQPDFQYRPHKKQNILKVIIDKVKNIFSVNKETGQMDLIHNSGNYLRIDGDGNVTEYVLGNYKRVIVGDYSEVVRGSKGVTIKGDNFEDINGTDKVHIKGSRYIQASGGITQDNELIVTGKTDIQDIMTTKDIKTTGSIKSSGDMVASGKSIKKHHHTTIDIGSPTSPTQM